MKQKLTLQHILTSAILVVACSHLYSSNPKGEQIILNLLKVILCLVFIYFLATKYKFIINTFHEFISWLISLYKSLFNYKYIAIFIFFMLQNFIWIFVLFNAEKISINNNIILIINCGLQICLCGGLVYHWKNNEIKFENRMKIDARIRPINEFSFKRIRKIRDIWFLAIMYWVLQYSFLLFINSELNFIEINITDYISRLLCSGDAIIFLVMYSLFRSSDPYFSVGKSLIRNLPIVLLILCVPVIDFIFLLKGTENPIMFAKHVIIVSSVITGISFSLLFGKFDSKFFNLPPFYIVVLFLYAFVQYIFPWIVIEMSQNVSIVLILIFTMPIMVIAKIIMSFILISSRNIDKLRDYFNFSFELSAEKTLKD